MSASREKKQRQGSSTAADKAQTVQQKAEQTRRKTIQYTAIGAVVAVLVAALLVWDSGFFQNRSAAVTVNGTNYSVAEMNYYYRSTQAYQYASWMGYDNTVSARDQVYSTDQETGEETTFYDYFMEAAMSDLETITALYDGAIAAGYSEADVKATVADSVKEFKETAASYGYSYKQFLVANYGKEVTPGVFEKVLARNALASKYLNDYAEGLSYTEEQYQDYYAEHAHQLDTFVYSYLYFTPEAVPTTDEAGNTIEMTDEERTAAQEANLAAAKEKAEAAKSALEEGESVVKLIEEYDLSSTRAAANATDRGSSLGSAYSEWLAGADRKEGDVELIENSTSGYYVVMFHDRYLDESLTADTRHILITAETDEGADVPTVEQMNAAKAKAEEIYSQWQTGAATEESFAELAKEYSVDSSSTDGGLYEGVPEGSFVPNYDEWLFSGDRKPGDTAVFGNEGNGGYYGWHVAYYVGEDVPYWRIVAENTMKNEETTEWRDGLTEGYTAQVADGAKYLAK